MATSPLLEAVLLPLIKQICFGAAQIHNLWTAVPLKKRERDTTFTSLLKNVLTLW